MINIISFFLGIIVTLVYITILHKLQTNKLTYSINEARRIKNDLELLCNQSLDVSKKIVNELEEKINYGKRVLSALEQKEKELESINKKVSKNEKSTIKPGKKELSIELSSLQKSVINMAEKGYCLKDISHKLEIEQDQAAMILQLYKEA